MLPENHPENYQRHMLRCVGEARACGPVDWYPLIHEWPAAESEELRKMNENVSLNDSVFDVESARALRRCCTTRSLQACAIVRKWSAYQLGPIGPRGLYAIFRIAHQNIIWIESSSGR